MKKYILFGAFLLLLFFCSIIYTITKMNSKNAATPIASTPTNVIKGEAKVIDGRTIEINNQKIRLSNIDAPDMDQVCFTKKKTLGFRCGVVSAEKLAKLISHQTLTCEGEKKNTEGNLLATCYVGELPQKIDINEQTVLSGWAGDKGYGVQSL